MSWVATAGGVLLGPVVGALASRLVTDAAKPKELTSTLFIGAAVHAAVAFGASELAGAAKEENLHAFAYGATWGNGLSAALLAAGGIYFKTDAGKANLALAKRLEGGITIVPATPTTPPKAITAGSYYEGGTCPAPKGLLGLLVAAKAHGYTT